MKWAQHSFSNFRVFPPSIGIVHQVNLEFLATVATVKSAYGENLIFPDTLVGTDSHTPMINGIGVLGWGVGGIEAEACMLGQPLYFLVPDVVGFKLTGKLPKEATATDLVLTITNILRNQGVVGKFVEFYGEGVSNITVEDRAAVSNMCPEYGTTASYFPVDHMQKQPDKINDILNAKVLALFGDSVTTDHISPAGSIPETSDAGNYLTAQNVKIEHYNSYGSRRGTHEVMMRALKEFTGVI